MAGSIRNASFLGRVEKMVCPSGLNVRYLVYEDEKRATIFNNYHWSNKERMGRKMVPKDAFEVKKDPDSFKVLNPVAVHRFKPISPARRLEGLKNKKIGLYWNHKARGNIALDRVKALLSERYEGMSFQWFETGISVEASKEWFENVKKSGVDAIVASTGD